MEISIDGLCAHVWCGATLPLRFRLPEPVGTARPGRGCVSTGPVSEIHRSTDLDQRFSRLQKVLLSLRLGSFLEPPNDRLVANTVLVVQHLRALGVRPTTSEFMDHERTFRI